jgi:hypothetical protein
MSNVDEVQSPAGLAADAELRAKEILDKMGALQRKQAELHAQYSTIQELDPKSAQLDALSRVIDETGRVVGSLARQRTELLDGLPIITDAQGHVCVAAAELAKDANLVERVKGRLQNATKAIATAEKLLVTVSALLA